MYTIGLIPPLATDRELTSLKEQLENRLVEIEQLKESQKRSEDTITGTSPPYSMSTSSVV